MIHSVMGYLLNDEPQEAIRGSLEGSFNPARQARLEISYQLFNAAQVLTCPTHAKPARSPCRAKNHIRDHVDLGRGAASCVCGSVLLPSLYLEAAFRPRTGGGR